MGGRREGQGERRQRVGVARQLQLEAGGGSSELQDFVDKHLHYLDLLENIKSDLIGVYTDITTIKNAI